MDSSYQIVELIGEGGMGQVYSALDLELQRTVAIKILSHYSLIEQENRTRFIREGRLLSQVEHPCIIRFYKFGEFSSFAFIAMEYVAGTALSNVLMTNGPYKPEEACTLLRKIAGALDFIHEQGLIHRDIKPANILIDEAGVPKVIDFGLARATGADKLTNTGALIGTAAYMSPEQCLGQKAQASSDLYSFACLAFECMVGYPPCGIAEPIATIYKQVNEPPLSVNTTITDPVMAAAVNSVFLKALNKNPHLRYSTANEFIDRLERAIYSGDQEEEKPAFRRNHNTMPVIAAVATMAMLGGLLLFFHAQATSGIMGLAALTCGEKTASDFALRTLDWLDALRLKELALTLSQDLLLTDKISANQKTQLLISLAEQRAGDASFASDCIGKALAEMARSPSSELTRTQFKRLRQLNLQLPASLIYKLENWNGSLDNKAEALDLALNSINSTSKQSSGERAAIALSLSTLYETIDCLNGELRSTKHNHLADAIRVLDQGSRQQSDEDKLRLLTHKGLVYFEYERTLEFLTTMEQTREFMSRIGKSTRRTASMGALLASSADLFQHTGRTEPTVQLCNAVGDYLNTPELLATKQGSEAAAQIVLILIDTGHRAEATNRATRFCKTNALSDNLRFLLACTECINGKVDHPRLLDEIAQCPPLRFSSSWINIAARSLETAGTFTYMPFSRLTQRMDTIQSGNNLYLEILLFDHDVAMHNYEGATTWANSVTEQLEQGDRSYLADADRLGMLVRLLPQMSQLPVELQKRTLFLAEIYARNNRGEALIDLESVFRYNVAAYPIFIRIGQKNKAGECLAEVLRSYDFFVAIYPGADVAARCALVDLAANDCNFAECIAQTSIIRKRILAPDVPKAIRTAAQARLYFVEALTGDKAARNRLVDFCKMHKIESTLKARSFLVLLNQCIHGGETGRR